MESLLGVYVALSRSTRMRLAASMAAYLLTSAALVFAVSTEAGATAFYQATAEAIGPNSGSTMVEASYDVSIPLSGFDIARNSAQAYAAAGPAGLRASARDTLTVISQIVDYSHFSGSATGSAEAIYSDFVVTGPPCCAIRVPMTLNLDVSSNITDGANLSATGQGGSLSAGALSQIRLSVEIKQAAYSLDVGQYLIDFGVQNELNGGLTTYGSAIPGTFTTSPVMILPGSPFQVSLKLDASTSVSDYMAGGVTDVDILADALADVSHTVTFHTGGPVFGVPTGFTVNSVDAGIVDNAYVIPEPATMRLLLPGLLVLWWRRALLGQAATQTDAT